MWGAVVEAAAPYMERQNSEINFEFFGLDVIADTNGRCWLIEINRLPGLESSIQNKLREDYFYNSMMCGLLQIVLNPIFVEKKSNLEENMKQGEQMQSTESEGDDGGCICGRAASVAYCEHSTKEWILVRDKQTLAVSDDSVFTFENKNYNKADQNWINTLKWKAFTRKYRHKVLAAFN